MRRWTVLMAACALAGLSPVALARETGAPAFIPAGELADAPWGFTDMCARDTALCRLGQAQSVKGVQKKVVAATAPLGPTAAIERGNRARTRDTEPSANAAAPTDALFVLATAINRQVNAQVFQAEDARAWGVGEVWQRPQGNRALIGDCEDLAIEKRWRLMEQGFPADRLFYAVVWHQRLGLHTILIARMTDGDYVLDSLSPRVELWSKRRYVWLREQVPGEPENWVRIATRRDAKLARSDAPATLPPA